MYFDKQRDIIPTGMAADSVKVKLGGFRSHLKFSQPLKHSSTTIGTTVDCFRVTSSINHRAQFQP